MISILVSTAIRFPIRHQHLAIVAALSAYKKLARFLLPSFRYGRKREVETGKSRENDLFSSPRGRERKEEEKGKKEGEQEGARGGKSHLHLRLRARNPKEWDEGEGEGLLRVITRIRLKVVPASHRYIFPDIWGGTPDLASSLISDGFNAGRLARRRRDPKRSFRYAA